MARRVTKAEVLETLSEAYTAIRMERDSMPFNEIMQARVSRIAMLIAKVLKMKAADLPAFCETWGIQVND